MRLLKRLFTKKIKFDSLDLEHTIADSLNLSQINEDSYEGRFEKSIKPVNFYFIIIVIIIVVIIFVGQLFRLQILENDKWVKRSDNNFQDVYPIFPFRGLIKDRNGELLAWNNTHQGSEQKILVREYIKEEGFSNLLGYIKYPKKDKNGIFWQEDYVPEAGIELYYNDLLKGKKGNIILETNASGDIVKNNIIDNSVSGKDLFLTIDKRLQTLFYSSIKKYAKSYNYRGGSGVMMDLSNGEILAMVSYPDYNNNILTNASSTEDNIIRESYFTAKDSPLLHRAVQSAFTPGSIVKPFMGYFGLEAGLINRYTRIYSSGELRIENKYGGPDTVFKDNKAHGNVDLIEALGKSSNIYFYEVGGGYKNRLGLGINKISEGMNRFSWTKKTGIDFPSEIEGVIPTPEWKKRVFNEDWLIGNTYHTSIGQYGYKITPISALNSYSFLINNGLAVKPQLLLSYKNNGLIESVQNTDNKKLNLNQSYLNIIKEGMEYTSSEKGTAHYLTAIPFKVAGKSGTAQIDVNNSKINSWFVGYFPAKSPKYSFIIFLEGGPSSNTIGATHMSRYLLEDMILNVPEYFKDII